MHETTIEMSTKTRQKRQQNSPILEQRVRKQTVVQSKILHRRLGEPMALFKETMALLAKFKDIAILNQEPIHIV